MSSHRAIASTIAVVLKAGVADTMATLAVTRKVPGIYLVAQNKAKPLLVARREHPGTAKQAAIGMTQARQSKTMEVEVLTVGGLA